MFHYSEVPGTGPDACRSTPVPPEQIFEHEFRPEIRQDQKSEPAQGPCHGSSSTPAVAHPADQQHAENDPSDARENGLVLKMLSPKIGHEDESGEQRQGQERETRADQPE